MRAIEDWAGCEPIRRLTPAQQAARLRQQELWAEETARRHADGTFWAIDPPVYPDIEAELADLRGKL